MKKIILAGVLVAFPSMNPPTRLGSYLAASRWANQAIEAALPSVLMFELSKTL